MCPEYLAPLANRRGIGLITAVFAIVILALFGLLIARYTVTTQMSSAEDYIWAESLYSAESVMRLNILRNDGGGKAGGVTPLPALLHPTVAQILTTIVSDTFTTANAPATIRVQAQQGTVSRMVEAKYLLQAPP